MTFSILPFLFSSFFLFTHISQCPPHAATCLAQNQLLLNQALFVLVEQGGLVFLNLGGFRSQAGELGQPQEEKGRGPAWTPTVPSSLLWNRAQAW